MRAILARDGGAGAARGAAGDERGGIPAMPASPPHARRRGRRRGRPRPRSPARDRPARGAPRLGLAAGHAAGAARRAVRRWCRDRRSRGRSPATPPGAGWNRPSRNCRRRRSRRPVRVPRRPPPVPGPPPVRQGSRGRPAAAAAAPHAARPDRRSAPGHAPATLPVPCGARLPAEHGFQRLTCDVAADLAATVDRALVHGTRRALLRHRLPRRRRRRGTNARFAPRFDAVPATHPVKRQLCPCTSRIGRPGRRVRCSVVRPGASGGSGWRTGCASR